MASKPTTSFWNSRIGRKLAENLTAYAFLSPAALVIAIFGLFPVAFAFFVSLHQWRRFPGDYLGFANYTRALGNFAYILFFWLALGAIAYGLILLWRWARAGRGARQWLSILPSAINTLAIYLLLDWFFKLLPVILDIPQRIRGQERVQGLFVTQFFESLRFPHVLSAANLMVGGLLLAALLTGLFMWATRKSEPILQATTALSAIGGGGLLLHSVWDAIALAIAQSREAGVELPIWSQIIIISAGFALLYVAYRLWRRATHTHNDRAMVFGFLAAVSLLVGAYICIAELPRVLAEADKSLLQGFNVTVMFSLGTVPVQLVIGMLLAYLLFQDIRWRSFFRIVYFLPYITPFAATSVVFTILFANRPESLVNQIVGLFGIPSQKWLLEPTGIGKLIFGPNTPDALAGPGLALVVILIYSIWTYFGYNTVVFLAGLGNISPDLYEAARIDGANRWREFRHITFPLLSPTTFFLTLVAVIGTFKAFTQIWIMRQPSAYSAVDTASVYIFETARAQVPNYGYGAAMAFVLFGIILLLTIFQNRVLGERVIYD